jgi:hypothetical protein
LAFRAERLKSVMAGLVPAIHDLAALKDVDARDKPAHDGDGLIGESRLRPRALFR